MLFQLFTPNYWIDIQSIFLLFFCKACGKPCQTDVECDDTCPVCKLTKRRKSFDDYPSYYDDPDANSTPKKVCSKSSSITSRINGRGFGRRKGMRRKVPRHGGRFRSGRPFRRKSNARRKVRRRPRRQRFESLQYEDYNDEHEDDYGY